MNSNINATDSFYNDGAVYGIPESFLSDIESDFSSSDELSSNYDSSNDDDSSSIDYETGPIFEDIDCISQINYNDKQSNTVANCCDKAKPNTHKISITTQTMILNDTNQFRSKSMKRTCSNNTCNICTISMHASYQIMRQVKDTSKTGIGSLQETTQTHLRAKPTNRVKNEQELETTAPAKTVSNALSFNICNVENASNVNKRIIDAEQAIILAGN